MWGDAHVLLTGAAGRCTECPPEPFSPPLPPAAWNSTVASTCFTGGGQPGGPARTAGWHQSKHRPSPDTASWNPVSAAEWPRRPACIDGQSSTMRVLQAHRSGLSPSLTSWQLSACCQPVQSALPPLRCPQSMRVSGRRCASGLGSCAASWSTLRLPGACSMILARQHTRHTPRWALMPAVTASHVHLHC